MKSIFLRIAKFGLSLLLGFIVIESYIQLAEVDSTSLSKNDSLLGSSIKPNKKLIAFNEGFYLGGSNKYGYWGPGYDIIKPDDCYRIALIGDSYVEGHQVFERNHFRTHLEQGLSKKFDKKVEVLNFGISGFNLNDGFCMYYDLVKKFNPDLTLIFVSNEDFSNTNSSDRRPICVIEGDSLYIDYSFRDLPEFLHREKSSWYRGKSVVLGYVFGALTLIKEKRLLNKLFPKWVEIKESNYESFSKNVVVAERERKIVKHFLKSKQVIFVGSQKLDDKIVELFKESPQKLISIPNVDDKMYHYWKVTDIEGHWNLEGHKLIGNSLVEEIIELKI